MFSGLDVWCRRCQICCWFPNLHLGMYYDSILSCRWILPKILQRPLVASSVCRFRMVSSISWHFFWETEPRPCLFWEIANPPQGVSSEWGVILDNIQLFAVYFYKHVGSWGGTLILLVNETSLVLKLTLLSLRNKEVEKLRGWCKYYVVDWMTSRYSIKYGF